GFEDRTRMHQRLAEQLTRLRLPDTYMPLQLIAVRLMADGQHALAVGTERSGGNLVLVRQCAAHRLIRLRVVDTHRRLRRSQHAFAVGAEYFQSRSGVVGLAPLEPPYDLA